MSEKPAAAKSSKKQDQPEPAKSSQEQLESQEQPEPATSSQKQPGLACEKCSLAHQ